MEQSVSGSFPLGEPQKVCGMLARRVLGWRRFVPSAAGAGLGLALCASYGVATGLNAPTPVTFGSVLLVFVLGVRGVQWICRHNGVRAMRARGAAADVRATWALLNDGVKVVTDRGESLFYWSGIDEIARTRDHWVIMVLGMGYVLPRRFFVDPSAEQQFMQVVWSRLTPPAKERSENVAGFLTASG